MFGRIFGRGKGEPDQAVCASCGRTLLAGEWTQQIPGDNGEERLICSLCAQSRPSSEGERVKGTTTPANGGRVRESRSDSDAFWKALKDKDLEIERLQALLARAEAEKQELLGRLAHGHDHTAKTEAQPAETSASLGDELVVADDVVVDVESWHAEAVAAPGADTAELAAETWGETPADLAAALAEFSDARPPAAEPQPQAPPEPPAATFENTQPIAMDEVLAEAASGQAQAAPPIAPILAGDQSADDEAARRADEEEAARLAAEREAAEREAEAAASLTLLQRGVDLLNVSAVPRKIAETNEHLGLPAVHVGFDGKTAAVTFLWSMGWYRFAIDLESGAVRMDDRGYDERRDLQPNAGVRADGTVHLAPAQISRAAAARQASEPQPPAAPADDISATAETPSLAAQKAPEFISKSLLGQRSDDEPNPWDGAKAREFNWDR